MQRYGGRREGQVSMQKEKRKRRRPRIMVGRRARQRNSSPSGVVVAGSRDPG